MPKKKEKHTYKEWAVVTYLMGSTEYAPIVPGTFKLSVGRKLLATDDGSGNLLGKDLGGTGSKIKYETGEYELDPKYFIILGDHISIQYEYGKKPAADTLKETQEKMERKLAVSKEITHLIETEKLKKSSGVSDTPLAVVEGVKSADAVVESKGSSEEHKKDVKEPIVIEVTSTVKPLTQTEIASITSREFSTKETIPIQHKPRKKRTVVTEAKEKIAAAMKELGEKVEEPITNEASEVKQEPNVEPKKDIF